MTAVLLHAYQAWYCPNCGISDRTPVMPATAARFHPCAKLRGLIAPLIRAGTDCKVTAIERADYLGGEQQRTGDDGRPYMAVVTERADGSTDVAAFAAVATARIGELR